MNKRVFKKGDKVSYNDDMSGKRKTGYILKRMKSYFRTPDPNPETHYQYLIGETKTFPTIYADRAINSPFYDMKLEKDYERGFKYKEGGITRTSKFYITYNKGRGQGKGIMTSSASNWKKPQPFNSYRDAEEYIGDASKDSQNMTSYWVSDINMNRVNKYGEVEVYEKGGDVKFEKGDHIKLKNPSRGKSGYAKILEPIPNKYGMIKVFGFRDDADGFDDIHYAKMDDIIEKVPRHIRSNKYGKGGEVSLYFQQGSSDKEYHIQMEEEDGGYVVNFQYGRRGRALKSGTKTASPVSLQEAEKIYDKLLNSKVAKGYSVGESNTQQFSGGVPTPKTVHKLPQLLNMVFTTAEFINDDSYLAQEKRDGERRMVVSNSAGTTGLNKKGQEVPLPHNIVDSINDECIIDGEIIGDTLYAFDILSLNGQNLEGEPCIERISTLNTLRFGEGVIVVETAYNTEEKQEMFDKLEREHREGIVFKKKESPYTHGRPSSGGNQLKFKFYKTATFIVANLTPGKRSVGLELMDNGDRRFMGKVTIPPNKEIPNVGDLVEVRYLYAYKDGAVYQPTYIWKREDSDLTDATIDQIVYKSEDYSKGGALEKEFKFDKNFVIYVPSTSDVGKKISKQELDKRVDEVEKFVANEFGGYTETDTDGGYKSTSGEIIEEDVIKVSVFAKGKEWKKNEQKVVNKVKDWAKEWGQEAIGFEYEGDLYYIDDEGKFAKGGSVSNLKTEYIKFLKDNGVDVDRLKFRHIKSGPYGDEEVWTHPKGRGGRYSGVVMTRDHFEELKKDNKDYSIESFISTTYAKGGGVKESKDFYDDDMWDYIKADNVAKSPHRANDSLVMRESGFEDGSNLNLIKLNPSKQTGENTYKYAVSYYTDIDGSSTQKVLNFKTLEDAENQWYELIGEKKQYSPLRRTSLTPSIGWTKYYEIKKWEKGGEVKKGNEMVIGGLAGILLGIFLNK